MFDGYSYALRVLDLLSGKQKDDCVLALGFNEKGFKALSSGNLDEALEKLLKAHSLFAAIPEAATMLGNSKAWIAFAHYNLRNISSAKTFAKEAIVLMNGVSEFLSPTASAYMTLGCVHYHEGDAEQGAQNFNVARQMFRKLGDEKAVMNLDANESKFKAAERKTARKWW